MQENNTLNLGITNNKLNRITVKKYTVDHQNYHIFKAESDTDSQFVHFQWGKFDFRMTFSISEKDESKINSKNMFSSLDGSK